MQAKIYSPTKSAMQTAQFNNLQSLAKDYKWRLEFLPTQNSKFIDKKLGYVAATDMMDQVHLVFNDLDAAITYAKAHNIDYVVIQNHYIKKVKKNYANNFSAH